MRPRSRALRAAAALARHRAEARYYNPGVVYISRPYVFATAYGPHALERTEAAYDLLSAAGWVWQDRTGALRASVQMVDFRTVSMGSSEAFYAPFVEMRLAPVETAFEVALDRIGYR